ncbi:MAG TPA: type II toxin-antitoxin system Phd/YefM family antitoxin [Polyangia bacterium]
MLTHKAAKRRGRGPFRENRTAALVRDVSKSGQSVTITQNGEAKVVVMGVETYDRWRAAMTLLKLIAQGEADLAAGRTVTQKDAFRRAAAALL